jgi:hypothetical protein
MYVQIVCSLKQESRSRHSVHARLGPSAGAGQPRKAVCLVSKIACGQNQYSIAEYDN